MGPVATLVMLAVDGSPLVWQRAHLHRPHSPDHRRERGLALGGQGVALTIALFLGCPYYGWRLKVGDMTPGSALLFPSHPYNVAYAKLNEKSSARTTSSSSPTPASPDGMKNVETLTMMEEFADHMETAEGAGISVTIVDIMKQLSRLFHEGEPKWSFVPDRQKYIAELFYQFTQTAQAATSTASCPPTCGTARSSRSSTGTRTTSS
jgi:hypothetical protein